MKPLAIIVAIANGNAMGMNGALPWHVPEDLKHFRELTTGHAIIMGRRTFESIGKPLPKRLNIVVSRTMAPRESVHVVKSLDEAITFAEAHAEFAEPPFVVGGAALYAEALPRATELHLTEIRRDVAADTFFPKFDREAWREVGREPLSSSSDVTFLTLCRPSPKKD